MSRGRLQFRNPAEAVAAAKCWLNTFTSLSGPGMLRLEGEMIHPDDCAFCSYPRDMLIAAIEEFNGWAALDQEEAPIRLEVEQFLALPAAEQLRLVKKAQAAEVPIDEEKEPWWSAD
jgi:hypothetical protein